MDVLVIYLSVCSLAGLPFVISKGPDVNQQRNVNETVRGWADLFEGISVDGIANETIPEFLNFTEHNITRGDSRNVTADFGNGLQRAGNGYNGSEGYQIHIQNDSVIPVDLAFRWWSVVRPFGNEMATKPKFPWTVAVQSKLGRPNSHLCSGNILTKLYVLTTCRCLSNPTGSTIIPLTPKDPSFINIVAGVSMLNIPLKEQLFYGQIRNAVGINIHPHCSLAQRFDYGVIELEYYLYYTDRVLPIPDPFETLRRRTSSKGRSHPFLVKESEICQAAGWPLKQSFWDDDFKGEQKVNDFKIVGKESCLSARLQDENQLICAKVDGDRWKSTSYPQPTGDVGSGLVCRNSVTAILSYHQDDYAVFASLRPALSFLWQFYLDHNEIYTISSSHIPAVSMTLLVFAIHVTVIPKCL